jgi:hypothetical protein
MLAARRKERASAQVQNDLYQFRITPLRLDRFDYPLSMRLPPALTALSRNFYSGRRLQMFSKRPNCGGNCKDARRVTRHWMWTGSGADPSGMDVAEESGET